MSNIKRNIILVTAIVIIIIIGLIGTIFWHDKKITAFEGISKSQSVALNWKNDAVLNRISSGYAEVVHGKCKSWEYTYISPSSIIISDSVKYREIIIIVHATGEGKINSEDWLVYYDGTIPSDIENRTADITNIKLNLGMDSDEVYDVALSNEFINNWTSRYFGYDAYMDAEAIWENDSWGISFDSGYGPDRGHASAGIMINSNTGDIEHLGTGVGIDPWYWEYNFYKYQVEIIGVIIFILIIVLIIYCIIRRRTRREQNQSHQENDK